MKPCRIRCAALAAAFSLGVAFVAGTAAIAADNSPGGAALFEPTRFTVRDAGPLGKPDVVLIPGLSCSRAVWDGEVKALEAGYRLHLLQVNGFAGQAPGENARPEPLVESIEEQLHRYIASRRMHPVVIGHSLGGILGLMLTARHPEDVSKLVVLDSRPFAGLMITSAATVRNIRPMAEMMRDGAMKLSGADRVAMEQQAAQAMARSEAGRKQIVADGLASDPTVTARALYEEMQTDLRPNLAAIHTPTLVLYAADPTLVYPNGVHATGSVATEAFHQAYAGMPNVTFVQIDNSRHFMMLDQPQRTQDEISRFLSIN